MFPEQVDVVILGGGLAGATLALQLTQQLERPASVVVLEKQRFPLPEAAHKVGESSVELGAYYLAKVLDLEAHIHQRHLPKFGLRFFFNQKEAEYLSSGFELGLAERYTTPSYQLDRGILENHLADLLKRRGVSFLEGCLVSDVDLGLGDGAHRVSFRKDGAPHNISCRWVVDAMGRRPLLKKKLALRQSVPHRINAVWFRLDRLLKIDDWGGWDTEQAAVGACQNRWLSTNHLMGEGYWVWLIPLSSGCTSVGIVADPRIHDLHDMNRFDRALSWLERFEPACAREVAKAQGGLMDFHVLKHFSYGADQVFSRQRWAITGEAGLFLDPFYSPGSDFIAMSNTFVAELISGDLAGRPVRRLAAFFDQVYREFFEQQLSVYLDQYKIFGNGVVMAVKILWDYAFYWTFPAFFFIQGRMADLPFFTRHLEIIQRLKALSGQMQQFFKSWHELGDFFTGRAFIDQCKIPVLAELNAGLTDDLDENGASERFSSNAQKLKEIAVEMVDFAVVGTPKLKDRTPPLLTGDLSNKGHLAGFFEELREVQVSSCK